MRERVIRLDRRLGRLWSRLGGSIFMMIGVVAMLSLTATEGFSIATDWPGLAIASLFFVAAFFCFRSRRGLMDSISDNHPDPRD